MKVVVFGTFDIFHPGHKAFLKQAENLGDYLLVVVARDQNVKMVKGNLPINTELRRLKVVRKSKLANKVILGSRTNNYFTTLRTHKINLIALGYDQKPTIPQLKKALKKHHLANLKIIRLKAYNANKFKSSKLLNNV